MTNSYNYLVDSDAFVALYFPNDALASTVDELLTNIEQHQKALCTTNWVIAETATVLSNKVNQESAVSFLSMIEEANIPILPVTAELERETYRIFREQTRKHTSMVDCSNVAVAKYYGISDLLAFDKFYERFELIIQKNS